MKVNVEFEVTGCKGCILSKTTVGYDFYCGHPKVGIRDDIDMYIEYSHSHPDWCPILNKTPKAEN